MASKINEAKDMLMTEVEDNPEEVKKQEESNDQEEMTFDKPIINVKIHKQVFLTFKSILSAKA